MESTLICPNCSYSGEIEFTECPRCGIIVSKFIRKKNIEAEDQARIAEIGQSNELAGLSDTRKLSIQQRVEKAELWLGFETRNRYTINTNLFEATETRTSIGAILSRLFMANWRPFSMDIENSRGIKALSLSRPFRFYFHELDIYHANGMLLGTVRRRFGIFRRHYSLFDFDNREIFTLFGPILHPWTFYIMRNSLEEGKIAKKWSGLLKETFTKADNFGVEFPQSAGTIEKALLMGAVFLIDFVHFEKSNG